MSKVVQSIRGMHDTLPEHIGSWQQLEAMIRQLMHAYCIDELRTPALESMELFCRSIGEVTDIVEKEMYAFADRNGDMLALRPEGTASAVRAGIEHGLFYNQTQRLWYMGKMYRHERPQQGRYREFCQFGVEAYGFAGAAIEAELIGVAYQLWQQLGLQDITLEINNLGSNPERAAYRQRLIEFYEQHIDLLGVDEKNRLHSNPLRILDSKNPQVAKLNQRAPLLAEHLGVESSAHFQELCAQLEAMGIAYTHNPQLVRGLDYYNHTVFEFKTQQLGAQGTICAGGRYDGLVAQLGGRETPAFGFAAGVERLLSLLGESFKKQSQLDVFIAVLSDENPEINLQINCYAQRLNQELHHRFADKKILLNLAGGSLKTQLKKANRLNAQQVLILGENEMTSDSLTLKNLQTGSQQQLTRAALNSHLDLD